MKKFWLPTLQLIVSGAVISALGGAWHLGKEEIKFHVSVNERLAWIEKALGKQNEKEKETHVATNH